MSKKSQTSKNLVVETPHAQEVESLLEQLEAKQEDGLTDEEATSRLEKYGPNELEEHEEKSLLQIFIDQVNNPVVYLLAAAAVLAFVFGDIPEGVAIIVVLVLNAAIGFWMEFQARQSMNALREMDKVMANVLRGGEEKEINAEEIVPGDILKIQAGDMVSADARIIEQSELAVDESPLTGESVPVQKNKDRLEENTQAADQKNMIFKGTAVTNGNGLALVVATGMNTEIGSISKMVDEAEDEQIPLNRKLQALTKNLIWVTLGLAAAFFVVGWLTGKETYQLIQTSIAWTIAAIPEGLPIVASIALARGMLRLAKHNVIVKRLAAVETLGETTVIFTDKTGTLTKNQLTVDTVYFPDKIVRVEWMEDGQKVSLSAKKEEQPSEQQVQRFLEVAILCNDAELNNTEDRNPEDEEEEHPEGKGDPLDLALLQFGKTFDREQFTDLRNVERLAEEPFDSEDMVQGVVCKMDGKKVLFGKGASEAVLDRCDHYMGPNGVTSLSDEERTMWQERNEELSENGLRVIAFAFKEVRENVSEGTDVESDLMKELVFHSLVGFIDPPREEVKEAMDICRNAGIKVEMVTGDHPGTAKNIAKQVRMIEEEEENVVHGKELKGESNEEEEQKVIKTRVFARVDPKQKLDLIEFNQKNGEIVAMTGDGVNDAPALKKADIGIAMGKNGTQVAQQVADMVLKDDAFSSIVEAIREGRVIFGNIRKFIMYQLSYHLCEILVIASISFTLFQLPLLPLQLLFLNLLSDVFPALALGIGKGTPNLMTKKPKDPEEPIINKQNWFTIGTHGVILTLFIVGAYIFGLKYWGMSEAVCNNIAFFSLALAQLWHVFDMREGEESFFNNQVTRNKYIWMALAFCLVALVTAYFIPKLKEVLSFQDLETKVWGLILVTSVLPILTIQLLKELTKKAKYSL